MDEPRIPPREDPVAGGRRAGDDGRWRLLRKGGPARSEARYFLEVLALCGFAVAQPLLDVFGRSAQEFLTASATRSDIILFALIVAFAPAIVVSALAAGTRLAGERTRRHVHHGVVAVLTGLFFVQALEDSLTWPRWTIITLSGAAAAVAAALVARYVATRLFLAFAAAAPPVFVALFLLASPVSSLVTRDNGAAAARGVYSDVPILFLVFDELPTASLLDAEGHIDAELFPNFAALADDATWYRNHTTVATRTGGAVPAIVTGQMPTDPATVPVSSEYPQSLFTLLGRTYNMNVAESFTRLCPSAVCGSRSSGGGLRQVLRRAGRVMRDRISPPASHEPGAWIVPDLHSSHRHEEFARYARTVGATTGPRLDFASPQLPHGPWQFLPSGNRHEELLAGMSTEFSWMDEEAADVARQQHLEQLRLTDRYLGRMLDTLEERGVYDETLVVVTADHGVSFEARLPFRPLAEGNEVDIAWVPLMIKAPGQARAVMDDRNAMTIDILPTIADLVGIDIPWEVDGVSLTGEPRSDPDRLLLPYSLDLLEPTNGDHVVLDGDRHFAELLDRAPARPPGDDPDLRVFRHGEYADLIGRPVDDLDIGRPSEVIADLDGSTPTVDPTSDLRPVTVRGELSVDDTRPYAVALNSTIATWTRGHGEVSDPDFWAFLPETLLHPGTNELGLYEVTGPPDSPTLHPVTIE